MFTPIIPEVVTTIRTQGAIKFFVFEGWDFVAAHKLFTTIPHKIVYVKGCITNEHYRVFDCKLTLSKHSFIVEEITEASRDLSIPELIPASKLLSKPSEYMFLGMTIEAAENMAKLSEKENLVITSKLPTFSEIVSELNFTVRKSKFSDYFKATKMLQYKKGA